MGWILGSSATCPGGTSARWALRCPGCPPRFRLLGEAGGLRFMPTGSDEGGLDELVELSLSRASRSRTLASRSAIRCCIARNTAVTAAWESEGILFQSSSGIGSGLVMARMYRHHRITSIPGCERLREISHRWTQMDTDRIRDKECIRRELQALRGRAKRTSIALKYRRNKPPHSVPSFSLMRV